jgi:hypothetical protein
MNDQNTSQINSQQESEIIKTAKLSDAEKLAAQMPEDPGSQNICLSCE